MPKQMDIESDSSPMHPAQNHPHLEAMQAEFKRHKIAFMCAGMVAGVCVAGGVSAAAGAISLPSPSGGTQGTQSVTVVSGTTANPVKTQGWFSNDEEKEVEAYCWDCDHAPSRGWNWNWGYGKCHCEANWEGACCDKAISTADIPPHGPYMGEPGTFELYTFDTKDTASKMEFPDANGNNAGGKKVPPEFAGLWWMDGNPASDYVASFGRSDWKTVADDGYVCVNAELHNAQHDSTMPCLGGMDLPVYDQNVWSWHDEALGRTVYGAVLGVQLTYKFECGGDDNGKLTYCQIYPNADLPFTSAGSWISIPKDFVSFDMTRASDDTWIRNSIIAGWEEGTHNYYLKRITMGDGSEGEHWDDYMSHGRNAAPKINDVFGFGEDSRDLVSDVLSTQCLSRKVV